MHLATTRYPIMALLPDEWTEIGKTAAASLVGSVATFGLLARRYFKLKSDIRDDRSEEQKSKDEQTASKRWSDYIAWQDKERERLGTKVISLEATIEVLSKKVYEAQGETIKCEARMVELRDRIGILERYPVGRRTEERDG